MAFKFFKDIFKKIFTKNKPKKLGLALGSGGALGFAHVGVLRAFEEEGISFSVVAGSSIGSIVGGFYALGFTSNGIIKYLEEARLFEPQKLIALKLAGYTTEKVLDQMTGGAMIEDLKIAYSAVAVDLYSGEEEHLKGGNLAKAMCASSAIPPFFKPVEIDGKKLVDGAFLNSVPSDVCKSLGADIVIGVNLSCNNPTNEQIVKVCDEIYKGHNIPLVNRAEKGDKHSDYLLCPNLSQFSSTDIRRRDELIQIGYECAKKAMDEIKKIIKG